MLAGVIQDLNSIAISDDVSDSFIGAGRSNSIDADESFIGAGVNNSNELNQKTAELTETKTELTSKVQTLESENAELRRRLERLERIVLEGIGTGKQNVGLK